MPELQCLNCGYKPHPDEGANCTRCNTPLNLDQKKVEDFADRDSAGSQNGLNHTILDDDPGSQGGGTDELGLQSTAQFVEQKNSSEIPDTGSKTAPISIANPSINGESHGQNSTNDVSPDRPIRSTVSKTEPNTDSSLKKLSAQQIKEIEKDLYGSKEFLTESEKLSLIRNMPAATRESTSDSPAADPNKTQRLPNSGQSTQEIDTQITRTGYMAKRTDGTAFYFGKFIQILGEQDPHSGDLLTIQNRRFILQRKQISSSWIFGGAAGLAALILIIFAWIFSSNSSDSLGSVIGMALDESDRPIHREMTVRFPDVNESVKTSSDGFFELNNLEAGSHRIEFVENGSVLHEDFVTVISGEITSVVMHPLRDESQSSSTQTSRQTPRQTPPQPKPSSAKAKVEPKTEAAEPSPQKTTSASKTQLPTKASPVAAKRSKLTLAANVEDAKVVLDGRTLGAGNLTYQNIKPGNHTYEISKSGYETASGNINLPPGKTTTLKVSLSVESTEEKQATYQLAQFIESGQAAIQSGRFEDAVSDFDEAIQLDPGKPNNHMYRAEAHHQLGNRQSAYDDYIRAAEIFRFKGKGNKAITAYNKAIDVDQRIITAYLGRGSLYLARSQEIAAVADYETAVRVDKQNAQAYLGLADTRFALGNYKKAVKHYKDARSLEPSNPAVHKGLMLSYLRNNKIKDVSKAYEQFEKNVSASVVREFKSDPKYQSVVRLIESK